MGLQKRGSSRFESPSLCELTVNQWQHNLLLDYQDVCIFINHVASS